VGGRWFSFLRFDGARPAAGSSPTLCRRPRRITNTHTRTHTHTHTPPPDPAGPRLLQAHTPAPAARLPGQVQGGDALLHLLLDAPGRGAADRGGRAVQQRMVRGGVPRVWVGLTSWGVVWLLEVSLTAGGCVCGVCVCRGGGGLEWLGCADVRCWLPAQPPVARLSLLSPTDRPPHTHLEPPTHTTAQPQVVAQKVPLLVHPRPQLAGHQGPRGQQRARHVPLLRHQHLGRGAKGGCGGGGGGVVLRLPECWVWGLVWEQVLAQVLISAGVDGEKLEVGSRDLILSDV